ncbi:MAG: type I DNA topoisomerase [Candidatus Dormiibacterota bacterium]
MPKAKGQTRAGTATPGSGSPLIIVESPAKARTLERYLGGRYTVRASMGAIRDLPKSDMGIDEDHDFEQTYVVIPGKEKVITDLRKAAKGASAVVLATDPDREGESISWHIAEVLKLDDPSRVEFEEITKSGVERALQEPRKIDVDLVSAQRARRVIDRLMGYKVSPVLWRKVKPSISAGRVQSVAVRLVTEREAEIEAFQAREYWSLEARLKHPKREPEFTARLLTTRPADAAEAEENAAGERNGDAIPETAETDDFLRPELPDEATTQEVLAKLEDATYTVRSVETRERASNPRAPYETSTLQQDASTRLRFGPRKAMQVAQQLYEGVELGHEGLTGLITYMRTDQTRLSAEAIAAAKDLVTERFGADYSNPRQWEKKKGKAAVEAQGAHEAIRPTDVRRTPESVERFLSSDQQRLYTLIWRRFMASQMTPARYEQTRVDIDAAGYLFRATGSIRRFDGFERAWEREVDDESGIPELSAGEVVDKLELVSEQHFTQPPPRYTEASLIKELEERGIGRPSTYAPTIDTIEKRSYVKVIERRLHPTPLGKAVTAFLVANFEEFLEYDFTADMEANLDKIENGQAWVPFMRDFNEELNALLSKAAEAEPVRPQAERTGEMCPKCGEGELVKREGRYGEFVGCSRYPNCDYIKDREERQAPQEVGKPCPLCGKPLVQRQSRRGPFIGCSGYPDCRYIDKEASAGASSGGGEQLEEGATCPTCGEGELVKKRGRMGEFLGCSRYPDCKFIQGQRSRPQPVLAGRDCPECGKPLLVRQGRRGAFIGCSGYPKCRHVEAAAGEGSEPASAENGGAADQPAPAEATDEVDMPVAEPDGAVAAVIPLETGDSGEESGDPEVRQAPASSGS